MVKRDWEYIVVIRIEMKTVIVFIRIGWSRFLAKNKNFVIRFW